MAVRLAVDTNRYTDLCRGIDAVVSTMEEAHEILLPFVTIAVLRAGFAVGSRGRENERILYQFLMKDAVNILYADDQTTHHYASVYRQLREQGTPIPTNDIWIAALVLQHNLILYSRDEHFSHLSQITIIA